MKGLDAKQSLPKGTYCSEITKEYLKALDDGKFRHIIGSFEAVPFEKPIEVPYRSSNLRLTFIKSNHCPGSSMVLLESDKKSVLLTGDMRCEKWWVESLPQNEFLYPYTSGFKTFDNIYLDTTYAYRDEPYIILPPNIDGINILNDLIAKYPLSDEDIGFYFADNTFGFEDVWVKVFNRYKSDFHTSNTVKNRRHALTHQSSQYRETFTKDILSGGLESKFHICGKLPKHCSSKPAEFSIRVKALVDISLDQYISLNMAIPTTHEEAKWLTYVKTLPSGNKIFKRLVKYIDAKTRNETETEYLYLLTKGSKEFLPSEIFYVFSRHSSHQEIAHFLSKFPKIYDITPTVECETSWELGFQIERHFKDFCIKKENFYYDVIHTEIYKYFPCLAPLKPDIDKLHPVSTPAEFHLESFRVLKSKEFSFMGQDDARKPFEEQTAADILEVKEREKLVAKGMCLAGRNQHRIREGLNRNPYYLRDKSIVDNDTRNGNDIHQESQNTDSPEYERAMIAINQRNAYQKQQGIKDLLAPPILGSEANSIVHISSSSQVPKSPSSSSYQLLPSPDTTPRKTKRQRISEMIYAIQLSPPKNSLSEIDEGRVKDNELKFKAEQWFPFELSCMRSQREKDSLFLTDHVQTDDDDEEPIIEIS